MNLNRQQRRALVLILAAVIIIVFMQSQKKPAELPPEAPVASVSAAPSVAAPVETVNACFARKRIEKGTRFDDLKIADLVELRKNVPKDAIPGGVASSLQWLKTRIAVDDVEKGEPIVMSRFLDPAQMGRVSDHIPDGRRAITLRIDRVRGVAGFLNQGDFVDVIGSFTVEGRNLTKYVMPKVKILAVNTIFQAAGGLPTDPNDPNTPSGSPAPAASPSAAPAPAPAAPGPIASPSPGGPPNERGRIQGQDITLVTFEVTPSDAERLIVASEHARLYLILRNPNDPETPKVDAVDAVDVYVERPKKAPVPKYDVDVLRGIDRKAVPVRLESVAGMESTTDRRIYYEQKEEAIRQIKEEDFSAGLK